VVWACTPPVLPPNTGIVPQAEADGGSALLGSTRKGTSAGGPSMATSLPRRPPVALTLPGRASAQVIPEEVTDGRLDLPASVSTIGWWSGGAALGEPRGSIVLAGHVDSAAQGLGYFAALRDLQPGDRVEVRGSDGQAWWFAVTGRRSYSKARGLPGPVFDQSVTTRLVLITCTGRFNRSRHSYEDNLVVFAVPVPGP
jgi:hypothetical protein